ncbi:MAG: hypothetical protein HQK56_20350 [Deltaproteobacteria bacterium]|nr:hypothetical protein [Deltaproteobacteria bacterium]
MDPKAKGMFRDDELITISRFDRKLNQYVNTIYPKLGGRLRLAHEENKTLSISTQIVNYDQNVAVVQATVSTQKGTFSGIGMYSVQRDEKLAPVFVQICESIAIARALRFAGYGVEYCGAEEISHLNESQADQTYQANQETPPSNGNGNKGQTNNPDPPHPADNNSQSRGGNGANNTNGNGGNGNGNGRVTNKQLEYIIKLGKNLGMNSKDLDEESVKIFGVKVAHLKVAEASSFIQNLNGFNN